MAKRYPKLSKVLQKLLYEKRLNTTELARKTDLPVPTVHRLVTGKSTRPYPSSLKPIADYFSLNVEQLLGEEPLPDDSTHTTDIDKNKKVIEIPVLEWKDLEDDLDEITTTNTIIATHNLSSKCIAIAMNDSSMEPHFQEGSILILDPDKEIYDRSYVLVKLAKSGMYIFRQLLIDAEDRFLKPLNPDLNTYKMRLMDGDDKIIASLVEARQTYGKN